MVTMLLRLQLTMAIVITQLLLPTRQTVRLCQLIHLGTQFQMPQLHNTQLIQVIQPRLHQMNQFQVFLDSLQKYQL